MDEQEKKPWFSVGTKIKLGLIAGAAALVVVVLYQNREQVEPKFLGLTLPMPLFVLMIVSILAGFALGMVVSMVIRRKPGESESGES